MKEIQNVTAIGVKTKLKRIETQKNQIETQNNRIETRIETQNNRIETRNNRIETRIETQNNRIQSRLETLIEMKNLEEIQDQIVICAKREIKVQKRNKSLKKEIKVLIEKGK